MTISIAPHPTPSHAPVGFACNFCGLVWSEAYRALISTLAGVAGVRLICSSCCAAMEHETGVLIEDREWLSVPRTLPTTRSRSRWLKCAGPCGREMQRIGRIVFREGSEERVELRCLSDLVELVKRSASDAADAPRAIHVIDVVEAAGCPA
jgi:hypothetical protein